MITVLTASQLEAALRKIGSERYHHLHRFHERLHGGGCTRNEVCAWALNRYCYQAAIPIKDATVLMRMSDPALRREWRKRIEDHDGNNTRDGGIARWLALTGSLGLAEADVVSTRLALPATRFAVNAYVTFCRERSLLEAIASSLTEMFSPDIIGQRISGMLQHYDFVSPEAMSYFTARPPQANRDVGFALDYVRTYARTAEQQRAVLEALEFKCDVLWAQLDALWLAYVEGAVPPGAWQPGSQR
jgi:coenzyme PQQ biosynthesis protein C